MPQWALENWKWWHTNWTCDIFVNGLYILSRHLGRPENRDRHAMFRITVTAINCSRCHSLSLSYINHWRPLRRGQSSHSLSWGRKSTPTPWWYPSVPSHTTHSSRRRCRPRRSSRMGRTRACGCRRSPLRGSHSSWCPERGENCNSLEHMMVAEPASNCSQRNRRQWRNRKAILRSRQNQGTKSLIV